MAPLKREESSIFFLPPTVLKQADVDARTLLEAGPKVRLLRPIMIKTFFNSLELAMYRSRPSSLISICMIKTTWKHASPVL